MSSSATGGGARHPRQEDLASMSAAPGEGAACAPINHAKLYPESPSWDGEPASRTLPHAPSCSGTACPCPSSAVETPYLRNGPTPPKWLPPYGSTRGAKTVAAPGSPYALSRLLSNPGSTSWEESAPSWVNENAGLPEIWVVCPITRRSEVRIVSAIAAHLQGQVLTPVPFYLGRLACQ